MTARKILVEFLNKSQGLPSNTKPDDTEIIIIDSALSELQKLIEQADSDGIVDILYQEGFDRLFK
jgi:hypothetical protein